MTVWLRKNQGNWLVPALFLFVCVLAYGLQVFNLGFYLDDWVILDAYNAKGALGLSQYAYFGNRPLVFWLWWIGFKLFQSVPAYWQIWSLLWRWLAVVITWMACRLLWPKAERQVALAGLLFAVYPLFRQQATALTFSFHWICFFLWGLSIYWMILAVRRPERFSLYMAGSFIAGAVQLFSQEFFIGLELLRPVILWIALLAGDLPWKTRLKRVVLAWLPFLLMFFGYLVWRIALMPAPGADRNSPRILYGLVTSPLQAIASLLLMFFQDTVQTVLGIWYDTYQPGLFVLTPIANLLAWGVAVVACLGSFVYFWLRRSKQGKPVSAIDDAWYKTAIPFGFIAMTFGFLPGWMIGRHIYDLSGIYNDRFGLASTLGAAILVVGVIEFLIKTETYRLVLVCILIGLGAGQNFRYETNYRWSWEKQLKLYWQIKWRAPEIQKPTTVYGDGSIASFIGNQVTSSAINEMYGPVRDPQIMDFRYQDVNKIDVEAIQRANQPLAATLGYMDYRAPANSNLVIAFEPEKLQCLWVLGSQDQTNPYLAQGLAKAVPLSNLNQILPDTQRSLQPDIFGPEPAHDWCYYYQKGDLARQMRDWGKVVSLWNEAQQNGRHPHVGVEYGPFIEGFAHTGSWNTAIDLTRKAEFPKYEMRAYVCSTWARIAASTDDSAEKRQIITKVIDDFECRDELH